MKYGNKDIKAVRYGNKEVVKVMYHSKFVWEKEEEIIDIKEQTIELENATWVSFYVKTTLDDLQNALGTNGVSISTYNTDTDTTVTNTYTDGVWSGDIKELDLSKMYIVKVLEKCTLTLQGELLKPELFSITLYPGWNWIGYPSNVAVDINDAFSNLQPDEGDIIKTQNNGNAEYAWGMWVATLKTMIPGIGYQYRNVSREVKELNWCVSDNTETEVEEE